MSKDTKLYNLSQTFTELTKHPEFFLSCQQKHSEKIKTFLKNFYDYVNLPNSETPITDILPTLIIDDLDEEQIWQQIEIKNDSIWPKLIESTSQLLSIPDENLYIRYKCANYSSEESDNENEENNSAIESVSENNNSDNDNLEDNDFPDVDKIKTIKNKIKIKPSIVDDKFFKLSELEVFLNNEDKKEMLKNKNSPHVNKKTEIDEIDYFASDSDEDTNENNVNYKDFFEEDDDSKIKGNNYEIEDGHLLSDEYEEEECNESNENIDDIEKNLNTLNSDSESDNDEDNDNGNADEEKTAQSSYEQRQERLRQRIDEYEEKALGEKPWQLKGEIGATSRPHNSLLEDILEYDVSARPPPVITEEFNETIEDIIRQRIKDKAWDDVVRIEKPISTPQELRKKLLLDPEKSKESLAQIYEKEYQKEIEKLSPKDNNEEEENPLHKEIKEMMSSLFQELDALSNFHFTPKPVAPEPKIITNTPVINMEEVAPVTISNAKLLAPEEIKGRSKGNVLGETERTRTDKSRERRHKKHRQKSIYKDKEINDSKIENKNISLNGKKLKNDKLLKNAIKSRNVSQVSASKDGNTFKSSKSFFSQLQDKTSTKEIKQKKRKADKHELSAKKLKL